jgi:glycosyltransferase involved in cell wall biosynthesis
VMQPMSDHDLNPSSGLRGTKLNLAYAFFEGPLGERAAYNAAQFDVVFVGSTWCNQKLQERGIYNGRVLIQGVDSSVFYPRGRQADGQFRIFSGGKFEWRKGQDTVLAAFREFVKECPTAHLVCAWHNPWPDLIGEVMQKAKLKLTMARLSQRDFYEQVLLDNGVPAGSFTVLPPLSHEQLAIEMSNTDVGLFPNRCEGGTNLVLMEYLACGGQAVANTATGHADIANCIHWHLSTFADAQKWAVHDIDDITITLDGVRRFRPMPPPATQPITQWTWERAAQTIAGTVEELWQH